MINIIIIQLPILWSSVSLVSKPHNNHGIDNNIGDDIKKISRYDYHGTKDGTIITVSWLLHNPIDDIHLYKQGNTAEGG